MCYGKGSDMLYGVGYARKHIHYPPGDMEMHQGARWDMESLEVLPCGGLLLRHKQEIGRAHV